MMRSSSNNGGKVATNHHQQQRFASERNRRKHTKNKLKKKHQKHRLTMEGSSFLYLFASVHTGGYVLYRFDFDQLSSNDNNNNDQQQQQLLLSSSADDIQSTPLSPCLSFSPRDLPRDFCSLVPLGDYFYFVGEKPDEFFRIRKFLIENLNPDEQNLASMFLDPVKSHMNYPKYDPLVFAANDNLYVISGSYSFTSFDFEMYSPAHDSWTVLDPIPREFYHDLKSFLVLGDTVFFATFFGEDYSSVLSFHLINKSWNVLRTTTSPSLDFIHFLRPTFYPPVVLIGQMLFGGLRFGSRLAVGASPHLKLTDDDTKAMFMRPSLAPGPDFLRELSLNTDLVAPLFGPSHCITALQTFGHDNVLSSVSYGIRPLSDEVVIVFTFFKIPGTVFTAPPNEELMDDYYASLYCQCHPQKESGTENYFDSEFMHRRLFKLPSRKLRGRLISCFTC